MSILIKGMEMPETCEDCEFHRYHSNREYVCIATPLFYPMNLANSKGIRKDFCPLEEVPECEDAISRKDAIEDVTEYGSGDTTYLSVGELKRRLEQLPSVTPQPKTGKWIYLEDDLLDNWMCDKCEGIITDWGRAVLPRFCPNCGVRMEE